MTHRLSTPDVTLFRAAVQTEWLRCAEAVRRMRKMGREDLAVQFIARLQELVELRAALDAGADLVLPKVAGRAGATPVLPKEEQHA